MYHRRTAASEAVCFKAGGIADNATAHAARCAEKPASGVCAGRMELVHAPGGDVLGVSDAGCGAVWEKGVDEEARDEVFVAS